MSKPVKITDEAGEILERISAARGKTKVRLMSDSVKAMELLPEFLRLVNNPDAQPNRLAKMHNTLSGLV